MGATPDGTVASRDELIATVDGRAERSPVPSDPHAPIDNVTTKTPENSPNSRVGAFLRFGPTVFGPETSILAGSPEAEFTN